MRSASDARRPVSCPRWAGGTPAAFVGRIPSSDPVEASSAPRSRPRDTWLNLAVACGRPCRSNECRNRAIAIPVGDRRQRRILKCSLLGFTSKEGFWMASMCQRRQRNSRLIPHCPSRSPPRQDCCALRSTHTDTCRPHEFRLRLFNDLDQSRCPA